MPEISENVNGSSIYMGYCVVDVNLLHKIKNNRMMCLCNHSVECPCDTFLTTGECACLVFLKPDKLLERSINEHVLRLINP